MKYGRAHGSKGNRGSVAVTKTKLSKYAQAASDRKDRRTGKALVASATNGVILFGAQPKGTA